MFPPTSPLDAEIAARLNDVALPVALLDRLRALPLGSDAELDAVLADVALPAHLDRRLSEVTVSTLPDWAELAKQSVAAVLLFAMGLSYAFSVVVFVAARFDQPALAGEPLRSAAAQYQGEPTLEQAWVTLDSALVEQAFDAADEPATLMADASIIRQASATAERSMIDDPLALAAIPDGLFGASPGFSLAELNSWPTERRSVTIADGTQLDDAFWRHTALLPWLNVRDDLSLEVPLVTDDASYRLIRREIATGRLPAAGTIRTEEFLAGVNYGFGDRRVTRPAIVVAAAPSPFGGPLLDTLSPPDQCSRWLIMVGVVSPRRPAADGTPSLETDDAQLAILFSPEKVKAVRLIGYQPPPNREQVNEHAGVEENQIGTVAFGAGDVAVVLFEIELVSGEEGLAELGRVRLVWRDARGSSLDSLETVVRRDSFSSEFDAAPVAWRQAALVALAAERLVGSPFAEQTSLTEIAVLARRLEPLVADRAGWRDFIEMVARTQSLKSSLLRAF